MPSSKRISRNEARQQHDVVLDRITQLLEEKGWSKTVLAEKSGISRTTIYNAYSSGQGIGTLVLRSIANALDVAPEFLLGITNNRSGITNSITTSVIRGDRIANDRKSIAEQRIQAIIANLDIDGIEEAASFLERLYKDRASSAGNRSPKPHNG